MDITILNGINLFSFILLAIGILCLVIEMFTTGLRVPAGVAFILFIIGIFRQADSFAQCVFMITIICGIYGLILFILVQDVKNAGSYHLTPACRKHHKNNRRKLPVFILKSGCRYRYHP